MKAKRQPGSVTLSDWIWRKITVPAHFHYLEKVCRLGGLHRIFVLFPIHRSNAWNTGPNRYKLTLQAVVESWVEAAIAGGVGHSQQ